MSAPPVFRLVPPGHRWTAHAVLPSWQAISIAAVGSGIGQSRAMEVLARSRTLTLPMIRRIAAAWHVPERLLVREYPLRA